eukprot:12762822-Alexandrium_andersonii.AAC.1
MAKLAVMRGLPACNSKNKSWSYYLVTSPGMRSRIEGHEAMARKRGFPEKPDLICDANQNPRRYKGYSRKAPALLRQAMMYSIAKRRCLLPGEALEVQGYH